MTNSNYGKIYNSFAELIKIANEDDFNEFKELRLQLENPN